MPDFRYYQSRNEQAQVHTAVAFARMKNRLQTLACTSSVGPGATNMVTGAAVATVNRLPVLLLPGDVFARRRSPSAPPGQRHSVPAARAAQAARASAKARLTARRAWRLSARCTARA